MDKVSDEFESYSELFRAKAAAQDFDDLNHAIAGREVGRHRKHIQDGGIDPVTGEKRKTASERALEGLQWLLLNDPEYARLHEAAMESLRDAEDKARSLFEQIERELVDARNDLAGILDLAAALPDGTKVFRDSNSIVRDKDGTRIADELAASIVWRGDEPSFEDYRSVADRVQDLEDATNEARGIETELGGYRGELTNENRPASSERVEMITDRINSMSDRMGAVMPDRSITHDGAAETNFEATNSIGKVIPTIKIGD